MTKIKKLLVRKYFPLQTYLLFRQLILQRILANFYKKGVILNHSIRIFLEIIFTETVALNFDTIMLMCVILSGGNFELK